jgi:hypothetical protein
VVDHNGAALTNRFGGNRTLVGTHPDANKMVGKLSIRLLAYQFVARMASPEVDPRDLKEFPRCAAEGLDQSAGIGALPRHGGNVEQQFLETLIGSGKDAANRRNCRTSDGSANSCAERRVIFSIHKCLNLLGNLIAISN